MQSISGYRRPLEKEAAPYYFRYIDLVGEGCVIELLEQGGYQMTQFLTALPAEKWGYRYGHQKWSIAEVLLHLIDSERIFAYRALRIARNDKTPLSGYEQDDYIPFADAANRSSQSIIEEYQAVRKASIELFRYFSTDMWARIGTASDCPFSALALAYIIIGHELHHTRVIEERYL